MKKILLILAVAVSAGCAGTYKAPTIQATAADRPVNASKQQIMNAAKIALATDGYQLTMADDHAGVISTAPRDFKLSPEQANCGTTMGLDYLKDKRTKTTVAFSVIATDGRVKVRSTIQGEYKPGAVAHDITLTCVSRGSLEQNLIDTITGNI